MSEDGLDKDRGPNPLEKNAPIAESPTPPPKKEDEYSTASYVLSVAIFVLGLTLLLIVGFALYAPRPLENQFDYGPNHFVLDKEGSWRFDWQSDCTIYSVPLRFNPRQVENVTIQGKLNESFNRPIVFIAFDPTQGNFSTQAVATLELSLNMVKALQVKPVAACTKNETDTCKNRPILSCGKPNASVILIKDEGESKIWLNGDCIVLFGKDFELLRSVDRLLYQWYDVMG